jgi:acetate kinase
MDHVLILNTGSTSVKWTVLSADETVIAECSESWVEEGSAARVEQIRAALAKAPSFDAAGHRVLCQCSADGNRLTVQ